MAINLVENKKENIFLSIFEGITVYKSGTKVLKNVDLQYLSFVNKNQKEYSENKAFLIKQVFYYNSILKTYYIVCLQIL